MKQLLIEIPDEHYADLQKLADEDSRTIDGYVAKIIKEHMYGRGVRATDEEVEAFRLERKQKASRITVKASVRKAIYERDGGRCRHCGGPVHPQEIWHVDHFIPLAKGGTNDLENLVLSCIRCNLEKAAK